MGPTKISLSLSFFPSSTKQSKTSFLPTFLSFIFHPPYNKNVQLNQKKKSKKEMWAILSKYFYPLFSPIKGDRVLVEEKRKRVSPTKISYSFPSSTKQPKTSFLPTFLSFIFHPPYNKNVQLNQKKKKKKASQAAYLCDYTQVAKKERVKRKCGQFFPNIFTHFSLPLGDIMFWWRRKENV